MNKVTIHFEGNLKQFGDKFELYADTINEAIRSLVIQIDGLKAFMRKGYYKVVANGRTITEKEYKSIVGVRGDVEVHISPRVAGSGKFGSFIVGSVLTAVGFALQITPLIQIGVGLMIGGVAQMLVKQPTFNNDFQGVEDSQSSAFTNLTNMAGQGKQIPRVYGQLRVGSMVISQGLSSYRTDGTDKIKDVQTPTYNKQRISPIPARDPDGKAYNIDTSADSVKEALTTISVSWS